MSELAVQSPVVVLDPEAARVGQLVTINGRGFFANTPIDISIVHSSTSTNIEVGLTSDATGEFSANGEAVKATTFLATTGANVLEDDEVVIGERTYTFKTTVDTDLEPPNEIQIGESAADSLTLLKTAINGDGGGDGSRLSFGTEASEEVDVIDVADSGLLIAAKVGGVYGDNIETTTTSSELSFTDATLLGGAEATGRAVIGFRPSHPGLWIVTISDGVNEVETQLRVTQGA